MKTTSAASDSNDTGIRKLRSKVDPKSKSSSLPKRSSENITHDVGPCSDAANPEVTDDSAEVINAAETEQFGRITDEFLGAVRAGKEPDVEEYAARYPQFAEDIRDLIPTLVLMESAKSQCGHPVQISIRQNIPLQQLQDSLVDFHIIRELGRGGMGVVYEAEQISLGRRVALKVLPPQLNSGSIQRDRFEREARVAAQLHHTNIVPVFGVGKTSDYCYYAMQYIEGASLERVLKSLRLLGIESAYATPDEFRKGERDEQIQPDAATQTVARMLLLGETAENTEDQGSNGQGKPLASDSNPLIDATSSIRPHRLVPFAGKGTEYYWQRVAIVGKQVANALQYAHEQNVTHRDIKPSNLVLDLNGTVWVTDFGLAKIEEQKDLTRSGDVLGTMRYLAPEALRGEAGPKSDIYSLGLTLYELIALRPAFDASDIHSLVNQITNSHPPALEEVRPGVPRDLATIIQRAIAEDPNDRYSEARDLADDLRRFTNDEPIYARRASHLEQLSRWARQNRSLATAVAGIGILLTVIALGGILAAIYFERGEHVQRRLRAEALRLAHHNEELAISNEAGLLEALETSRLLELARAEAETQRQVTRQNLYFAQMGLAQQTWRGHRGVYRTQLLLDNWLPEDGQADLRKWEWFYVQSLCKRELQAFAGHSDKIHCVAYAPQGDRLASASQDGSVRIWDSSSGKCEQILGKDPGGVFSLGWSPSGALLASAGMSGAVLWDTTNDQVVQRFATDQQVYAVAFSAIGDLAIASEPSRIEIRRNGTWDVKTVLKGHLYDVYTESIGFSPDGKYLAAPAGKTCLVWDVETGEIIRSLPSKENQHQAAVFSPDGQNIATTNRGTEILIWDFASGELSQTLSGHTHGVASVAWSPDGTRLASGSWDGTCLIFDLANRRPISRPGGHGRHVFSVAWHPSGSTLASGGDDNLIKTWLPSLADGYSSFTLEYPPVELVNDRPSKLALAPHTGLIAIPMGNSNLAIYDGDGRLHASINIAEYGDGKISDIVFSPDGSAFVVGTSLGHLSLWDTQSGTHLTTLPNITSGLAGIEWSPDADELLVVSCDAEYHRMSVATGDVIETRKIAKDSVSVATWSPDRTWLAVNENRNTPLILNLISGEVWRLPAESYRLHAFGWSYDGRRLAMGGTNHVIRVWDVADKREVLRLSGHGEVIRSVNFSPNDQRILSADSRGILKLWDATTGIEALALRGPVGRTQAALWSSEGRRVIATIASSLCIWDATENFLSRE